MFSNMTTQTRLLIATVLSVAFFIVYDFYFMPKKQLENNASINASNAAPALKEGILDPNDASNLVKAPITKDQKAVLAHINTSEFNATIDELGRISSFILNNAKFVNEDGSHIELISKDPMPLEVRFSDTALNELAFKTPYKIEQIEPKNGGIFEAILTQELGAKSISKHLTFYANGSYDLSVKSNSDFFITPGHRPDVLADGYTVHGVMLRKSDDSLDIIEDGDAKGDETYNNIDLISSADRYYTSLFYDKERKLNVFIQNSKDENTLAFVRSSGELKLKGYIGKKKKKVLTSIEPSLADAVEYGWFTFIARPVFDFLSWLYGYFGNWGWAIVVMTIVIRIILFPLTYKGMVSMNKLKDIAPKMKEIQEKYKGDPAKLNTHMMELYKKSGANPMGGCLPILLQIPIFFAIYRVLLNAIELKGAQWALWINDLAIKDPYFILPILMGVAMYLQQRITPTTFSDPMQQKIMRWLPAIFTLFFITFPAGLTLYWFTNNVCSLLQQIVVNKLFARHKAEEIAAHHKGEK